MRGRRAEWLAAKLVHVEPHEKIALRAGDLSELLAEIDQSNVERERWIRRIKTLEGQLAAIIQVASGMASGIKR